MPRRSKWAEAALNTVSSAVFSIAMGMLAVAVPLLALESGFGSVEVGLLVALSAVTQLIARMFMAPLLRLAPDKTFIVAASVMIGLACGVLYFATTLLAFIVSQVAQGVARALFFTGSQTHAARVSSSPVRAITMVNLASGLGSLIGPALVGVLLETSGETAMAIGAAIGLVGTLPGLALSRLRPFERGRGSARDGILRVPTVRSALSMGAVAGSWRGLVDSYVPIALSLALHSAATVGVLVAIANAALLAGIAVAAFVYRAGLRRSMSSGVLAVALGLCLVGPLAHMAAAAAAALVVSGLGAGLLQTLSPAVAIEAVGEEKKGDAVTFVGLARAGSLFVAPFAMAAIVVLLPVSGAFVAAGAVLSLPLLSLIRRSTEPPDRL